MNFNKNEFRLFSILFLLSFQSFVSAQNAKGKDVIALISVAATGYHVMPIPVMDAAFLSGDLKKIKEEISIAQAEEINNYQKSSVEVLTAIKDWEVLYGETLHQLDAYKAIPIIETPNIHSIEVAVAEGDKFFQNPVDFPKFPLISK